MGYVLRSFTALCLGTALAIPAQAQFLGYYPFGSNALSLNDEDYTRLIDTANSLLLRSPLPVGTTASWRNDQTGSAGTIRVTKTFRHSSMVCHRLVYDTSPEGIPPAKRTTLDWCDTGAGGWKILPS